jgi:hypothetical protein
VGALAPALRNEPRLLKVKIRKINVIISPHGVNI